MKLNSLIKGFKVVSADCGNILRRELRYYEVRPSISTLFLTYRCNSKCKTCTRWQDPQDELEKQEIGFAEWKRIIDQLSAAGVNVTEVFGGNVLLRKELLIQLLEYMHHKGVAIHMPTNQIGLDDDVAEAIIKHVHTVYISTDGLPQRQNDIRGIEDAASNVDQAITRLRRVRSQLSGCGNTTRIVCNNTVSRFNADIMEEMVEYAVNAGFDEIHFEYAGEFLLEDVRKSVIDGVVPDPHYIKGEETILVDSAMAARIKQSIKNIKRKYRDSAIGISTINIDTRSERSLWSGEIPHSKCYVVRNEVTVDPSGNLVPCPFITNYALGNLLTDRFDDVWNNEKHRRFLRLHEEGGLPMCANCILGVERNPGVLQSLKRVYRSRLEPVLFYR